MRPRSEQAACEGNDCGPWGCDQTHLDVVLNWTTDVKRKLDAAKKLSLRALEGRTWTVLQGERFPVGPDEDRDVRR